METNSWANKTFNETKASSESLLKELRLPTIRRFPKYLRVLWDLSSLGRDFVSSDKIANELNIDPITVRKDLAFTGVIGKPRIGYSIPLLINGIEQLIQSNGQTNILLIGAGNLGRALLGYGGLEKHGYNIVAAFDSDLNKVGTTIHNKQVYNIEQLTEITEKVNIEIGVLCIPEDVAQKTATFLVKAGIKAIWNFTNTELKVPEHVTVLSEDLASSLAVLSVNMKRNSNKKAKEE
ncbi:MAG: redox-sensing transcriptional repressor Rex [Bacteroidota bacterium]|nr:redox-sensing transcriptional repressor Rex [Bacteroidota bacterium]MDP4190491.1 redox-sensing transcriptional repressor Rex [Bacteroidota bacterium]MDP4194783.1 redox-sensing transcriptional repressor Rex [Bacteroidota bacterium]